VGDTYLLFSGASGLLIVDQHAAHERVLFEQLQERLQAGGGTRGQGVLWDEVMEASPRVGEILHEIRPTLEHLGFVMEPFGGNSWRIRAIPPWMERGQASEFLREVLDELEDGRGQGRGEEWQGRLLAEMACRGAVRGGRSMAPEEAVALLEEMRKAPARGLCPHGRPTLLEISFAELKRRFGRR
jgi:DNA mismatch repair protein MutL